MNELDMRVKELTAFMKKRERVRTAKLAGKKRPWTKDEILATYRFCNVHREDDAVTLWIAENWRDAHAGMEDLWFAMVVARLLNQPDSLAAVGVPLPWRPEQFRKVLHTRRDAGLRNFNAAYIVSTNGNAMDKVDYLVERVLNPLWRDRKRIRPVLGDTLASFHQRLISYDGLGDFMAAQVVADMKYVNPLLSATDWDTFAAPGPGSKRGLNRVLDRHPDTTWPGQTWSVALGRLRAAVLRALPGLTLHAQDLQNCLCEFDKYERVRLGEGRPKQIYQPKGN